MIMDEEGIAFGVCRRMGVEYLAVSIRKGFIEKKDMSPLYQVSLTSLQLKLCDKHVVYYVM